MNGKIAAFILLGHSIQLKIVTYTVNIKNFTLPLLYPRPQLIGVTEPRKYKSLEQKVPVFLCFTQHFIYLPLFP